MKSGDNRSEPMVKGAIQLPLPNNKFGTKMIFGGSDDDTTVCLNCDMPPERCKGGNMCYRKHKKKRDKKESEKGGDADDR